MCSKVSAAGGHFTWMRTFGDNVLQNSNTGTSETHGVPQVIRSSLELVKPRDGWSGLVFPSKLLHSFSPIVNLIGNLNSSCIC